MTDVRHMEYGGSDAQSVQDQALELDDNVVGLEHSLAAFQEFGHHDGIFGFTDDI